MLNNVHISTAIGNLFHFLSLVRISFKVRLPLSLIGILLILIITTSLTFMKVGTCEFSH